jgi:hypothetical protein
MALSLLISLMIPRFSWGRSLGGATSFQGTFDFVPTPTFNSLGGFGIRGSSFCGKRPLFRKRRN